jgi:hypothetical protein
MSIHLFLIYIFAFVDHFNVVLCACIVFAVLKAFSEQDSSLYFPGVFSGSQAGRTRG